MKAALVFPPLAGASQPYSSLPALTASIRRGGRHEIIQRDANVEFVSRLLTPAALRAATERVDRRLDTLHASTAHESDSEAYRRLFSAWLKAPIVCDGIEGAVGELKRPDTYEDLARLQRARRLVRDAFQIHSESCFPASLALSHLSDEIGTAADIDRRARDDPANPFRAFLADSLLPAIEDEAVGALGISITYPSQILPAVTLALLARQRLPAVPVVFGGQIASRWSALPNVEDVFRWCDWLVCFEGETAFEMLLSALESGRGLDHVPNLVYRDGARVVRNPVRVENFEALPTPDYQGLPLDLYLAPEPVFLLSTSRGCYWSACQFCSVSPSMRGHYRRRSVEAVCRDIATLQARHGARCVMFGDDCVPPDTLKALAGVLRELAPPISWECQVRFESALTADVLRNLERAGCRNLAFGLESYSPRVLSAMGKGIRHPEIARILSDCRRAGIAFNLQLFFGFPGETERDARTTIAFLVDQMHGAATFSVGTFELQRGSRMAGRPEAFGLQVAPQQHLSLRLPYTPLPEHAVAMKQLVERELAARMPFADAPLSLDAHTLLFLHHAGVAAMAGQYYRPSAAADPPRASRRSALSPALVLCRNPKQTVAVLPAAAADTTTPGDDRSGGQSADRIVLYDYGCDRAVELSPLALWVLQELDGSRSIAEVIHGSRGVANIGGVPAAVCDIMVEFVARRLVREEPRGTSAAQAGLERR